LRLPVFVQVSLTGSYSSALWRMSLGCPFSRCDQHLTIRQQRGGVNNAAHVEVTGQSPSAGYRVVQFGDQHIGAVVDTACNETLPLAAMSPCDSRQGVEEAGQSPGATHRIVQSALLVRDLPQQQGPSLWQQRRSVVLARVFMLPVFVQVPLAGSYSSALAWARLSAPLQQALYHSAARSPCARSAQCSCCR